MAIIFYPNDNTTDTLYMVVIRDSDNYWWNTTGNAFEAYSSGNYAAGYTITMGKTGGTPIYSGTFPTGLITAGVYDVTIFKQAGGSPAIGDVSKGAGTYAWDGTTLRDDSDIGAISKDAVAADNLETAADGGSYNLGGSGIIAASVVTKTGYELTAAYDAAKTAASQTTADNIYNRIGESGSALDGIPWNATWDAEVQSECDDALNVYDPPTNTEMNARTLPSGDYYDGGDTPGTTELLTRIPDATPGESGGIQLVGTKYPVTLLAEDVSGNIAADIKVISSGAIDQTVINNLFSNFALIEDYAATGVNATPTQILYMIMQSLHEFGISGVKRTVYKLDGETTAAEFTLDSDTAPTITTRTL
jgi:hypothetical protein